MTEEKRAYILHRLKTEPDFVVSLGIKNGMREDEILEKAAAALPPDEFELTPPPPPQRWPEKYELTPPPANE